MGVSRRRRRPVALALLAVLLGAGCSGGSHPAAQGTPTATGCGPVVANLVRVTQRYVDGIATGTRLPTQSGSASPTPTSGPTVSQAQFTDAVATARSELASVGCTNAAFQEAMQSGLQTVSAHGAVAGAVLAELRAELSGTVPTSAVTKNATPSDDLATVLAGLPAGSTLVLAAGTYHLPDTLVILRPITLRGAGAGATVLTSATADAAVLVLTDQSVTLTRLAVRRTGSAAGSVVVTGPTGALTLRSVTVGGARSDGKGSGGVGVLLSASGDTTTAGSATFTATDSTFSDNDSAGIAAGGGHRLSVTRSTFAHNRQCGLCYLGSSSGTVTSSTFTDDAVGVVVASSGRIAVRASTFTGGDVGIQSTGSSKPTIVGNVLRNTARASLVFVDTSAGTVNGNDCAGNRAGIAVARTAYPYVGTNRCRVTLG